MYLFITLLILSEVNAYYNNEDSFGYETESLSTPLRWFTGYGYRTRFRRHPTKSTVRTLSAEELAGVKDALQQIMPNHNLEELLSTLRETADGSSMSTITPTRDAAPNILVQNIYDEESTSSTPDSEMTEQAIAQTNMLIRWLTQRLIMPKESTTTDYEYDYTGNTTTGPTRTKETTTDRKNVGIYFNQVLPYYGDFIPRIDSQKKAGREGAQGGEETKKGERGGKGGKSPASKSSNGSSYHGLTGEGGIPLPYGEPMTPPSTRRTRRSRTTPFRIDIAKLMALVSNLTMSYQSELAALLNKSLEQYTIPTCPTPTTTTTTQAPTTTDMYGNLTGTVMGKCFVCGLDDKEMPRNAHCADAFAGDFIPLVPMNPTAKRHIARFRKYCRWMNVYYINESEPRSMWGRWTGGCSVRWIDVSGIYTQRTCRNRHRATMGQHWVSKRMAKLEMALQHIDNGCIISPMASLVPLSRGISMYARFHACVCTGNWCNLSPGYQWSPCIAFLTFVVWTML